MAYDQGLAERLRNIFDEHRGTSEKKMFGGIAFLLEGKMCCGIVGDELMVRVGPENYLAALKRGHVRPMDFTGRPMKGFVFVAPEGVDTEEHLHWWVEQSLAFARALLAQESPPRRSKSKAPGKRAGAGSARSGQQVHGHGSDSFWIAEKLPVDSAPWIIGPIPSAGATGSRYSGSSSLPSSSVDAAS